MNRSQILRITIATAALGLLLFLATNRLFAAPTASRGEIETTIREATVRIKMKRFVGQQTNLVTGLGTVVLKDSQPFIVTHDHWNKGDHQGAPYLIDFYNANNELIYSMDGTALAKKIVYGDGGSLILAMPELPGIVPVKLDKPLPRLHRGKQVYVVRVNGNHDGPIEIIEAEITPIQSGMPVPTVSLQSVNGEEIIPGDSGGGIWIDDQLVGNMWKSIRTISQFTLSGKASVPVRDQSFGAVLPGKYTIGSGNVENLTHLYAVQDSHHSEILDATVRITMYTQKENPASQKYNASHGLGTMIEMGEKQLIVTHNHWGALKEGDAPDFVEIRSAENRLLMEMSGDDFLKLILYRDSGTMVLRLSQQRLDLTGFSFEASSAAAVGDIVYLLHQDLDRQQGIDLFPARVLSVTVERGVARYALQSLDGQAIHRGDSGGGIWKDGRYVGNMWQTVEVTQSGRWPWSKATVSYSDKSFGASATAEIESIVSLNLIEGEMPEIDGRDPEAKS